MYKKKELFLRALQIPVDILACLVAVQISFSDGVLRGIFYAISVSVIVLFLRAYGLHTKNLWWRYALAVFASSFFIYPNFGYGSLVLILLSLVNVLFARIVLRSLRKLMFLKSENKHKIIFIGYAGNLSLLIAQYFKKLDKDKFMILGCVGANQISNVDLNYLGRIHQIEEIINLHNPDILIQLEHPEQLINMERVADEKYLDFFAVPEFLENKNPTVDFGGVHLAAISRSGVYGWGHIIKRLFDVLASFLLLIILSPIFLFIAISLKLENYSLPIIVKEERVDGRTGRRFNLYRFRTLKRGEFEKYLNSDEVALTSKIVLFDKSLGEASALGRFLRKTELNELPQLWNVLKNNMSLVGPRPPFPEEFHFYTNAHKKRHRLKPGITGLWQISKDATVGTILDSVKIDVDYIQNWTFQKDLQILIATIPYVLRKISQK